MLVLHRQNRLCLNADKLNELSGEKMNNSTLLLRIAGTWIIAIAILVNGYFLFEFKTLHPCEAAALSRDKYITKYVRMKVPFQSCYSIALFGTDLFGNIK